MIHEAKLISQGSESTHSSTCLCIAIRNQYIQDCRKLTHSVCVRRHCLFERFSNLNCCRTSSVLSLSHQKKEIGRTGRKKISCFGKFHLDANKPLQSCTGRERPDAQLKAEPSRPTASTLDGSVRGPDKIQPPSPTPTASPSEGSATFSSSIASSLHFLAFRVWTAGERGTMAAAMTRCRVLGGVESVALLQIRGRRLVSCSGRVVVNGRFGDDLLGIGREKKSESVTVTTVSELFKRQSSTVSRVGTPLLYWRQLASPKNIFSEEFSKDFCSAGDGEVGVLGGTMVAFLGLPSLLGFSGAASASTLEANMAYGEIGEGLEFGVQLIYLGALLALLGVGSFLVVRQVLVRRELESAAKDLQDRVRSGEASSEEFFELGAVMLRKKYYVLAKKYLEQAIKKWDGDEADLAQVYNALGFSYFSDDNVDASISQYEKAVKLQPGYVTAWNNLGNAYEVKKDFKKALKSYEEALQFDPSNKIAQRQRDSVKERVNRFQGIPTKD